MGFWGNFGGKGKWEPLRMQRPPIYVFSDIFGPDLMRRAVAFCVGIAMGIGENLGKFGSPQLPYQQSQENSAAGRHPFGPSTIIRKNRNHSAM